ncbi:14433_t:CDS:2, partial [Gigaspora rosea]
INCEYQDSNYIPEISFGKNLKNINQHTVACLEVAKGSSQNLYIFLSPGNLSIGRGNSNNVIIKDQEIAKNHAKISVNNWQVKIEKLESDYEIFVNGNKLESRIPRDLITDDVISMGRSEFQYLPNVEYISRMAISLTIYNKTYFLKKLEDEFKSAKENKRDFINDQNDHAAGDYVLEEVVNLIRNYHVRPGDTFARYGGDEFNILLKDADINWPLKLLKKFDALLKHIPKSENHSRESPNESAEGGSYHIESLVSSPIKYASTSSTMDEEIDVTIIKLDYEIKRQNEYDDDFRMGTNCHFASKNWVPISQTKESKLNLSRIIETRDDGHFLYIKESAKFDLLQLKDEKGFKFCTNDSIETAKKKAFKININKIETSSDSVLHHKDNTYKCDHEFRIDCKRCHIVDGKISDALEWFCKIVISDIIATDEFVKDVKAALERGAIIKSNSHVKNSGECPEINFSYIHAFEITFLNNNIVGQDINVKNMQNFHNDNTDVSTSINVIGGNKTKYSEDNIKSWDESESTWKIIGYNEIYPLFELLEEDLQKKVLSALGHRILKAGTKDVNFDLKENSPYIHNLSPHIKEIGGNVHSYQIFASIMSKCDKILFSAHIDYLNKDKNIPVIVVHNIEKENSSSTTHCSIKLGWIIVGPLTNFDFKVQFPL